MLGVSALQPLTLLFVVLFCCVRSVFDTISYAKGCCVIRTLEVFLGSEDFRRGLVQYMKQFEYGNALTDDLWAVLSRVSGKDVEKMISMTACMDQAGEGQGHRIRRVDNGANLSF
jgi:hypothetical protein